MTERPDSPFSGSVDSRCYTLFRVGIATLVLVRTTDWVRPLIELDHHGWVRGLDLSPWVDPAASPSLRSPLIDGLAFGDTTLSVLVVARTVLAFVLLLGIRPRVTAGALALVGYAVMAADRYEYLHHMHLLWLSCAWLALSPRVQRIVVPQQVARGPLSLLRLQALVVYAAAGLAKLEPEWLDGTALEKTAEARLMTGPLFELGVDLVGHAGLAITVAVWELALVPLLVHRRTRLYAVAGGVALHVAIDQVAMVSIFGATMVLYLAMFLPWHERPAAAAT